MDDTPNLREREVAAFEKLADGVSRLADVAEKLFNRVYPEQGEPTDVTVTRRPTEEDLIRQEQRGNEEEPIEQWIGPRELEFERSQETGKESKGGGVKASRGRAGSAGSGSRDNADAENGDRRP